MPILGKYYLLNSLPGLEANFQSPLPLSLGNFWRRVQEEDNQIQKIIQAIFLQKDINNLEQIVLQQKPFSTASLSLDTLTKIWTEKGMAELFLPAPIAEWIEPEKWHEEIWDAYFSYCFGIAHSYSNALQEWLSWNLGLKNAFYEKRNVEELKKREFSLPLQKSFQKSFEKDETQREYQNLIQLYYKASHPLEAEMILDKARWEKISNLATPYSFSQDEVVVYALHLLLLERWWQISQTENNILQKVSNV